MRGQRALDFDDSGLPRRKRVMLWLARAGYASLADLAADMGVHHTYPGKLLVARTEEITPEWRAWLVGKGCPEGLLW